MYMCTFLPKILREKKDVHTMGKITSVIILCIMRKKHGCALNTENYGMSLIV